MSNPEPDPSEIGQLLTDPRLGSLGIHQLVADLEAEEEDLLAEIEAGEPTPEQTHIREVIAAAIAKSLTKPEIILRVLVKTLSPGQNEAHAIIYDLSEEERAVLEKSQNIVDFVSNGLNLTFVDVNEPGGEILIGILRDESTADIANVKHTIIKALRAICATQPQPPGPLRKTGMVCPYGHIQRKTSDTNIKYGPGTDVGSPFYVACERSDCYGQIGIAENTLPAFLKSQIAHTKYQHD